MDKGFFKDAVIGQYEFDVAFIYFMKQHTMFHQWIGLSNPNSEDFSTVFAYLKLSISVCTVGDEQVQINDDLLGENDDKIMMSPMIKPLFYQIRFRFFRAEKLPKMDFSLMGKGSLDAYVLLKYMGKKLKTKVLVQKEGESIDWNQAFLLPCQRPIMNPKITMSVYDEDKVSDEIVGSLKFNLKTLIDKKNGKYFWKNVYGAPQGVSGKTTKLMNGNPDLGSTWKGRILMQVWAEQCEKPLLKVIDMPKDIIDGAEQYKAPK